MKRPKYNEEKLAELILYVCHKSEADERFGATKLNKILFYSDFAAYRQLGQPITGADYQNLEEGPAPRKLPPIRKRLTKPGKDRAAHLEHRFYYTGIQERLVVDRLPRVDIFTKEELKIVDEVIADLWPLNGSEVSVRSHKELGWKLTREGESIPYSAAWFSSEPLTMEEIERAKKIAKRHGLTENT